MSLEKLVEELSGGAAKLVTGKDANDLLNNLKMALAEGCGNPKCEVHGGEKAEAEEFDSTDALQFSVSCASAAHALLRAGKYSEAKPIQEQSFLWLQIREAVLDHLSRQEEREIEELKAANADLRERLEEARETETELQAEVNRLAGQQRAVPAPAE